MRHDGGCSTIGAGPDEVWPARRDGAGWDTPGSGVEHGRGRDRPVTLAAPDCTFPVRATAFEPPVRLQLSGGMPLGELRGLRTGAFTPAGAGTTEFIVRGEHTGPLPAMIPRSMSERGASLDRFAHGLKQRVESGG